MTKNFKKHTIISQVRYFLLDCFTSSKWKILITSFLLFVGLITGIIIGVKFNSHGSMNLLEDYAFVSFINTGVTSSFFSRLLSLCLMLLILFCCSFHSFLFPFAVIVLAFRTYLLGFNLCILFLCFGLPGILLTLFIILPCQIIMLAILALFYFVLNKITCDCRIFGGGVMKDKLKIILIFLLLLIVICLLETLLLLLFNANVIIVI